MIFNRNSKTKLRLVLDFFFFLNQFLDNTLEQLTYLICQNLTRSKYKLKKSSSKTDSVTFFCTIVQSTYFVFKNKIYDIYFYTLAVLKIHFYANLNNFPTQFCQFLQYFQYQNRCKILNTHICHHSFSMTS